MSTENTTNPVAPAVFFGVTPRKTMAMHHWCCELPDMEIYTLTEDIPGHSRGSKVSRMTLEAAGYRVPERTAKK